MSKERSFVHPKGVEKTATAQAISASLATDTFDGKIHVEWDPTATVTPIGQLPFFIQYLNLGGLFVSTE